MFVVQSHRESPVSGAIPTQETPSGTARHGGISPGSLSRHQVPKVILGLPCGLTKGSAGQADLYLSIPIRKLKRQLQAWATVRKQWEAALGGCLVDSTFPVPCFREGDQVGNLGAIL